MTIEHQRLMERVIPDKRLGSHFHKDSRSREFSAVDVIGTGYQTDPTKLKTKSWRRHTAVLDQGNIGSCTGNAFAGMCGSDPLYVSPDVTALRKSHRIDEALALKVYERATQIDGLGAAYPPNDRGSSTLGVLKAGKDMGLIGSYRWGFGLVDALNILSLLGAGITGVMWYDGFDSPAATGELRLGGSVRGGHELELNGIDVENKQVWGVNSWGSSWDQKGKFWWSWDTFGTLLSEQGEFGIGLAV